MSIGQQAEEALAFVRELVAAACGGNADAEARFWQRFAAKARDELSPSFPIRTFDVTPMPAAAANAYDATCLEFGKYAAIPIRGVPLDYLEWLADAQRQSAVEMTAYLRSAHVRTTRAAEIAAQQSILDGNGAW